MGSKQAIAPSIVSALPKADSLYDLFGGGFSISHYAVQERKDKYKHVHYNEIKADVVDLVRRSINGEYNEAVFKQPWVSREEFFERLDEAYIRQIWSFGNKGDTYLFGKDVEGYKKSMHMAVVFGEFDSLAVKVLEFTKWPKNVNEISKRRSYLRQKIRWLIDNKKAPVIFSAFTDSQLQQLQRLESLARLQQLERLQQCEQLQRLERMQSSYNIGAALSVTSGSYDQVCIKPESVVYCDIPYENTADYGNSFDREKFLDWAANAKFPVFISEYNVSDSRFKLFYSIDKKILLQAGGNSDSKQENLYWNGKEVQP
jgi:site-specific DNA-adenine methylase